MATFPFVYRLDGIVPRDERAPFAALIFFSVNTFIGSNGVKR